MIRLLIFFLCLHSQFIAAQTHLIDEMAVFEDVAINGLIFGDDESVLQKIGDVNPHLQQIENESPFVLVDCNGQGFLQLIQWKNELEQVFRSCTISIQLPQHLENVIVLHIDDAQWISAKGITLGKSPSEVISALGNPTRYLQIGEGKLRLEYQGKELYQSYYLFEDSKLIEFAFGYYFYK